MLQSRQEKILAVLRKSIDGLTVAQVVTAAGVNHNGVYAVLNALVEKGQLVMTPTRPYIFKVVEVESVSMVVRLRGLSTALNALADRVSSGAINLVQAMQIAQDDVEQVFHMGHV